MRKSDMALLPGAVRLDFAVNVLIKLDYLKSLIHFINKTSAFYMSFATQRLMNILINFNQSICVVPNRIYSKNSL